MKYIPNKNESGMALIFAIGLLALLLLLGLAFAGNSINYRKVAENNSARSQARMFALSAVSRAASSLVIYSHQYAKANPDGAPPKNLDHIFSFAKYAADGSVQKDGAHKYTDALLGEKSLMLLPGNYSVVNQLDVLTFNERFKNESWTGSWVFFTNGKSGSERRVIGRAAWQVIGLSASIAAPVFMRGHLYMDEKNDSMLTNDYRWGREIDEVFLDFSSGVFKNVNNVVNEKNKNEISDYEALYTAVGASSDKKTQRWVETWFLPELNGKSVKEASTMPGKYEGYVDEDDLIPRFNISELQDGIEWDEKYTSGLDQWYARFNINSESDANSENAIEALTEDGNPLDGGNDFDYEAAIEKRGTLPFLRHIGSVNGTFGELADLRKQIAANFNDYCDEDGIPTSNIGADKWLELIGKSNAADDGTVNHPLYTGNEKTPYLYELGMNFGLVSSDAADAQVKARKDATSGRFVIGLSAQAAPIVKLCNVYNFDPDEKIVMSDDRIYNDFGSGDFMRAYVDFDELALAYRLREAEVKDQEFSYVVTTVTETVTTDEQGNKNTKTETKTETKTFKYSKIGLKNLDADSAWSQFSSRVFYFSGKNWTAADGAEKIKPVVFSADDVKNTDGNKPYPAKKSSSAADAMWQKAINDNTTGASFDFSWNAGTLFEVTSGVAASKKSGVEFDDSKKSGSGSLDEYCKALGGVSEKEVNGNVTTTVTYSDATLVTEDLTSIDITKIKVESFSVAPRRAILTVHDGNLNKEIGVDYVRSLPQQSFAGQNIELELNPSTDGSIPGFVLGSYRNFDPRQNLNAGDWLKVDAFTKVNNFINPANDLCDDAGVKLLCLDGINKAKLDSDLAGNANFVPYPDSKPADRDEELTVEPAFTGEDKDKHISTAIIRNAPMMSPWEVGFIHRAVRWQTINLKHTTKGAGNAYLGLHDDSWSDSLGTSYSNGDAVILEQIKMTDRVKSYGKINVNRLRTGDPNFDDHAAANKAIIKALFQNITYGEDPLKFIKSSTRDKDGKFTEVSSGTDIDGAMADEIVTNFLAGNRGQYSRRVDFINWSYNDFCLGNGFHDNIVAVQDTDAAQEEIIGKTVNLISAEYSSPNIVDLIVVAQSIRDVDGNQVKISEENTSSNFKDSIGGTPDYTDLAADGAIMMPCSFGRFDMLEHKTDPDKNVYFDEITGEVKMFVRLYYDNNTGRMTILKIDYL